MSSSESSDNRRIGREPRLRESGQIILWPIEIAERRQFGIDAAQLVGGNAIRRDALV